MAHELEKFTDGTTALFTARNDAWHELGTVTTECLTAQQVMQVAYLGGWDVRKEALQTVESGAPVPNKYATTRLHPKTGKREVLGTVGKIYQPVQNEQACDLLNMIVDETGAHFETAGSLRGGREVFVTMKLPDTLRIAGKDAWTCTSRCAPHTTPPGSGGYCARRCESYAPTPNARRSPTTPASTPSATPETSSAS